jgi:hypothetical protein
VISAGRLSEDPPHRRDLHGEVPVLDRLAGPRHLDQWSFDITAPGHSTSARTAAKEHTALQGQVKWTHRTDAHLHPNINAVREIFPTFSDLF